MDLYLFSLLLGFCGLAVMALGGVLSHGHGGHHGHGDGGHDVGDVSLQGGHPVGHGVGGHHVGAHGVGHAGHVHGPGHLGDGHHGHGHGHDAGHHGHDVGPGHKLVLSPDQGHHGDGHHPGDGHGHGHHDFADDGGFVKVATGWLLALLSPRVLFSILVGLGAAGLLLRDVLGGAVLFAAALAGGLAFEKLLVGPFWNLLFRFASRPALTLESALMDTATAVTGFNHDGQGLVSIELDGQVVQLLATLRPEDRAAGVRVRAGDALLVEAVDGARNRCTVSWTGTTAIPAGGR